MNIRVVILFLIISKIIKTDPKYPVDYYENCRGQLSNDTFCIKDNSKSLQQKVFPFEYGVNHCYTQNFQGFIRCKPQYFGKIFVNIGYVQADRLRELTSSGSEGVLSMGLRKRTCQKNGDYLCTPWRALYTVNISVVSGWCEALSYCVNGSERNWDSGNSTGTSYDLVISRDIVQELFEDGREKEAKFDCTESPQIRDEIDMFLFLDFGDEDLCVRSISFTVYRASDEYWDSQAALKHQTGFWVFISMLIGICSCIGICVCIVLQLIVFKQRKDPPAFNPMILIGFMGSGVIVCCGLFIGMPVYFGINAIIYRVIIEVNNLQISYPYLTVFLASLFEVVIVFAACFGTALLLFTILCVITTKKEDWKKLFAGPTKPPPSIELKSSENADYVQNPDIDHSDFDLKNFFTKDNVKFSGKLDNCGGDPQSSIFEDPFGSRYVGSNSDWVIFTPQTPIYHVKRIECSFLGGVGRNYHYTCEFQNANGDFVELFTRESIHQVTDVVKVDIDTLKILRIKGTNSTSNYRYGLHIVNIKVFADSEQLKKEEVDKQDVEETKEQKDSEESGSKAEDKEPSSNEKEEEENGEKRDPEDSVSEVEEEKEPSKKEIVEEEKNETEESESTVLVESKELSEEVEKLPVETLQTKSEQE